ncbi:unannotated protein [freshwater metagenome]|uniref:Unannotated protein n=1 Tax=freshwater metagenome TaxID=449393 RepID=A0A6J6VKE8_9ZZZZ
MRAVVRAEQCEVVSHQNLGVHVIADPRSAERTRRLALHDTGSLHAFEQRHLPRCSTVAAPLVDGPLHHRPVDHDTYVASLVVDHLGQRGQDRGRRDDRRADANSCGGLADARCEQLRDGPAPTRGEKRSGAHGGSGELHRVDVVVERAAALDLFAAPQLLEVASERVGEWWVVQHDEYVLLGVPRVVGPVRRTRPHRCAIADDVLVVHEVGDTVDGLGRNRFA